MKPEVAAQKFPWFKIADDGVPEMYLDHQMLSTLRLCEGKFFLEHVYNVKTKGRNWSLEFGTWLHSCMDTLYTSIGQGRSIDAEYLKEWVDFGRSLWDKMEMEVFSPTGQYATKNYTLLGGVDGGVALLGHYWLFFGNGNERLRVVGTELPFGRAKEVPICNDATIYKYLPARTYLCGRIDLLIDDGFRISPLDHKSTARFDGKEHQDFTTQEALPGYILAVRSIIKRMYPDLEAQGRLCDSAWINHISLQVAKERFKRSRITKSLAQLEEYRLRQVGTFAKLWSLIIDERPPDWNAMVCDNIYHRTCEFKGLHEQDKLTQLELIKANFITDQPRWNPYDESTSVRAK